MPMPKQLKNPPTAEQQAAFVKAQYEKKCAGADADARRWIACGGAAEVRLGWVLAKNIGQTELMAIYEKALADAGFSIRP